ncbi:DUF4288 domain-containing protein [Pinibacter aurantiacus]|uniref:DUF4288 domain-containing protein n=1 Tax=Pinibacter aurantiacus TaxID=2851599 RepID=A0A9E2W323_9BACT|nr:DUF4288 domain-containing protein [Pinibacter aurantiacus]MBV4358020.1 DUF4288 domain-containing protein [Pinibacter aurantiacus]
MNWYLTKLVYQIICGDGNHTPQFDEQLRLIKAVNPAQALDKARNIGNKESETFFNDDQQIVQWKFIDVCTLQPIVELADGAEVFSQIQEYSDESGYLKMIKDKAGKLTGSLEKSAIPAV